MKKLAARTHFAIGGVGTQIYDEAWRAHGPEEFNDTLVGNWDRNGWQEVVASFPDVRPSQAEFHTRLQNRVGFLKQTTAGTLITFATSHRTAGLKSKVRLLQPPGT